MSNQNILITGARQGIARAYGFSLAKRGHNVLATTETDQQAKELHQEVQKQGLNLKVEKLDIRNSKEYQRGVDFEPDILINNAAIGESGPLANIPMERMRANFETNVYGTLELTQTIIPGMLKQGQGRIIIISSIAGKLVIPYLGTYAMTKFALEGAGEALRQELRSHNISVSLIEPGSIDTGFNERMNATKYTWFDEHNNLYSDLDRIQTYEKLLENDQHPPHAVTPAIIHAVESKRPKPRYVTPFWPYAPLVWFATNIIPDRMRDWLVRKMV